MMKIEHGKKSFKSLLYAKVSFFFFHLSFFVILWLKYETFVH